VVSCCGSSCRKAGDALALHEAALRRGIVVAPGPLFSARGRFTNFIRISAGTPYNDRLAAALKTVGKLVENS
jgi:DNA-binding transcriptional MocR family regulator